MAGLLDAIQAASNTAADTVAGPVDIIAALLRAAGVQVNKPIGGTDWMLEKGLKKPVEQSASRVAGETLGMLSPVVAAAKAPQIAKGLLEAGREWQAYNRALGPAGASQATVWHGSPHKFDKFDSAHIGRGEGAQAYGHGLYMAESPAVAQTYKDLNPTALASPIRAFKGVELTAGTPEYHAATLLDGMGLQQARKQVAGWIASARPEMAREVAGWQKTLETLNAATSKSDFKTLKNTGNMYKVDLPDNLIARMLDWDKPLSQQAPEVQKHFEPMVAPIRAEMARPANPGWGDLASPQAFDPTGQELLGLLRDRDAALTAQSFLANGLGSGISAKLRANNIPGIRYLDGGSRGAGQGTYNYVVFPGEENALTILERNGMPIGR